MKLQVPVFVDAPDDATHYSGHDYDMLFYKKKDIGVAGEHWFYWNGRDWFFASHHQPNWTSPIPEEWKIEEL